MSILKKWLNIAIIFILSFSLLSPAAIAEVQELEPNELDNSSTTISEVKFTVAPKAVSLKLYDAEDEEINIGNGVEEAYKVYTTTLQAGNYRYEGFDGNNNSVGGGQLTVTAEENQEFQFRQLNFKANNAGWIVNDDYTVKVGQDGPDDTSLKLGEVTAQGQIPVLALAGKTFFYTFEPDETHTQYTTLSNSITITIGTTAQAINMAIPFSGDVTFTIPQEAELFVGQKTKHFIEFEESQPENKAKVNTNGTKTYAFKLRSGGTYNYRVSQEGKLTNTGTFVANAQNAKKEITKEQLEIQSPKAILNKGTHLEGNLYLNINEQNHLKLNKQGDEFKLLPLRSWQALIEGIGNYFFEPDFHYEIITGEDVVEIKPGKPGSYATVKAKSDGTAIVKVTYDALKVHGSTYIKDEKDAFSAIWPENVGLFVVTVGQGETGISTGITSNQKRNQEANEGKTGKMIMNLQNGIFDADIDSVYYVKDEPGAYFTFTPTEGSGVSVLRPEINHGEASYAATFSKDGVTSNPDGSFTALLTEGRNIVKVENGGKAEYHVMTARPLDVTIENLTNPSQEIVAGNKVKVTFEGISFPANKLAGIYNFSGQLRFFAGPEQTPLLGDARQYNMTTQANSITFTIPSEHSGEYSLQDGHIRVSGFGNPIGDHRNIDPTVGANPNFTAEGREGYYSIFPTITIPITADAESKVDTTALQTAIDEAEQNKDSVKVSVDGKDVDTTENWVTQGVLDEYAKVIVSAQDLIADETAIQEDIGAKVLALNQATKAFNDAKKAGTKPEEPGVKPDPDPGETPTPPTTKTVLLSVEKRTMGQGDIIPPTQVTLLEGETAYTLLQRIADDKKISVDSRSSGSDATLYVAAIDELEEFDGGPLSGWMYSVNGIFPDYSAGIYNLKDGDVLRWQYTKNLGEDIGAGYVPGGGGGGSTPEPTPEPTPETEEITVAPNQPFVLDEKLQGNVSTPVVLNFGEGTTELPQVTAPRGDSVLEIPQGTKVTSAWDGKLQVPTSQSTSQSDLEAINKVLGAAGKEIEKVDLRIKVGGDQTIQFDQHVTLTFKGKAGLTPGFIGADGKFELIGTDSSADVYYYVSGNDLIVKTNHFTEFLLFNATDKTIDFSDIKGHWAEEFIREAARLGIIKGHVDGTFKPDKHLTRAQAVSILVRALDLQTDEAAPFKDIKGYAAETQAEIAAAYKYGLVIGQDGNFMPSKKVSRSQIALMLHRAYEQKTGVNYVAKEIAPYPDFGHYDEETINAISMLYEMGIATGSDGKYMPANPTQRAHAAKMLVNFFDEVK